MGLRPVLASLLITILIFNTQSGRALERDATPAPWADFEAYKVAYRSS